MLAAARPAAPDARAALAALCETYWSPVYEFVRSSTRSADDARDLTQAFFARVLEKNDLRNVRRERGRFRAYLLTAVRHFLSNQGEHDRALKRGGGELHVPIEPVAGDAAPGVAVPLSLDTPETIFEERWALTVLDAAMVRLARHYEHTGRRRLFECLQPYLTADRDAPYSRCAQELDMTEGAIRIAVHRMRRRFGECLREVLADTVAEAADVESELAYLLKVIGRRQAGRP